MEPKNESKSLRGHTGTWWETSSLQQLAGILLTSKHGCFYKYINSKLITHIWWATEAFSYQLATFLHLDFRSPFPPPSLMVISFLISICHDHLVNWPISLSLIFFSRKPKPLSYSRNTDISGNIIKHNLRTSMNKRTHFLIKIYLSHFILERVDVSVVCERWVERHILRERTSSSHIFFQVPEGANAYTLRLSRQKRLWSAACPSLDCLNLTVWFSFRLHTYCTGVPWSRCCLLITTWQLVKAHEVTRNEPKIHVICYITLSLSIKFLATKASVLLTKK